MASYRDLILVITSEVRKNNPLNSEYEVVTGQFENKTNPDTKVPKGVLEAWEISVDSKNLKYLSRIWFHPAKSVATCLIWDKETSQVAVGYKSGNIVIIKVNPLKNSEYEIIMEKRVCKGPVQQVILDAGKDDVYAISLDGYIHRCNFRTQETTFSNDIHPS